MKQIIRTACIAMAAAAIFSSCKKDDDKSRTELLTSGNWRLVLAQERLNGGAWDNVTADNFEACELDNRIKFSTPDVVTIDEGATKCNSGDPQTQTGTWNFVNNELDLNLDGELYDIDELNGNTLAISYTETFGGSTYTYQLVLKH